jgi:hypothetical protein
MTFIVLSLKINTGIYPWSGICRRNTGESTCGYPCLSTCKSTKGWATCSNRDFILIRDSITPCSDRDANLTRDELSPTRKFKSFKSSIPYWPGRNPNLSRGKSISSPARSFRVARDCTSTLSNRSLNFDKGSLFTSGSINPPETEQNLAPVQEVRHEVNTCTQLCYLPYFLINYSWLGNVTLSGSNSIIIKPTSGE